MHCPIVYKLIKYLTVKQELLHVHVVYTKTNRRIVLI